MATKIYDLSQLHWDGSAMWPQWANNVTVGWQTFQGIRSTSWHNQNHPGWHDMGWPWPFRQGPGRGQWQGHLHAGTHIDAPIYALPEGITADKIPLAKLYGTGVVLDFTKKGKWGTISAAELEKATPAVKAGDWVVINTGWQKKLSVATNYEYYCHYPGLLPDAADWLIKKKIKGIAGTWPVCDHSLSFQPLEKWMPWILEDYKRDNKGKAPGKEFGTFEGNLIKFLKAGISVVENAGGDIDAATGKRLTMAAWPFRLEETDAAMVRLVGLDI